jgi:hypothetical protein
VARLLVDGSTLVLRPNLAEKILDVRLRRFDMPLHAVTDARVVDKPWQEAGFFCDGVSFGFAGDTAPARALLTVSSRARFEDSRAAVYVYLNRRSVHISLDPRESRFARLVITTANPDAVVAQINDSRARLG